MTDTRQPKGIPTGGQFAATAHAEPEGAHLIGVQIGPAREMTREQLILVGQAVPGNPALSEITRQVHHNSRAITEAVKAMDETMLSATIIHAKQALPGAKEIRLRAMPEGNGYGRMTPAFIKSADDEFIGARFSDGDSADWAFRPVESADPESIADAIDAISPHSEIWDTDPRCDYDPQSDTVIIYLDDRRRHQA